MNPRPTVYPDILKILPQSHLSDSNPEQKLLLNFLRGRPRTFALSRLSETLLHPARFASESQRSESNRQPTVYKTVALPIELHWQIWRGKLSKGGEQSMVKPPVTQKHREPRSLLCFHCFYGAANAERRLEINFIL